MHPQGSNRPGTHSAPGAHSSSRCGRARRDLGQLPLRAEYRQEVLLRHLPRHRGQAFGNRLCSPRSSAVDRSKLHLLLRHFLFRACRFRQPLCYPGNHQLRQRGFDISWSLPRGEDGKKESAAHGCCGHVCLPGESLVIILCLMTVLTGRLVHRCHHGYRGRNH